MEWTAADEEQMEAVGAALAQSLAAGSVVALVGGLGAGKTRWTTGFARALGYRDEVTSPTFGLVHEYRGGRLAVFHFDLYRLKSEAELLALGWDEYCEAGGVLVVEWADLFPELLPAGALWLRLEVLPSGGRRISRQETGSS